MKLHYIALALLLVGCVTQQQMEERLYRSMKATSHLNISDRDLMVPECSQTECVQKYQTIQARIEAQDYKGAVETAISEFNLNTSTIRKIEIVDELGEHETNIGGINQRIQTLGTTSAVMIMQLSKNVFKSSPYLVFILVHELGHSLHHNRYYDIIKEVSGIDPRVSNHFLAEIIEAFAKNNSDTLKAHIKSYYHLGFIQEDRFVYNEIEITLSQLTTFINLMGTWIGVHSHYLRQLHEADVCLYTLKHRERLYLRPDSPPVLLQVENLRRGLANSFYAGWQLEIETAIMNDLRQTFNELPDTEKEKFKRALINQIEKEKQEIETYLIENGF